MRVAQEYGQDLRVVEAAVDANSAQKAKMVKKIRDMLDGSEADKTIAVLGLTFKPETDDMRDAPSLTILPELVNRGAHILAHDPQGMTEAARLLPDEISYAEDVYDVAGQADAIVLITEWNQYRGLHLDRVRELMRGDVLSLLTKTTAWDQHWRGDETRSMVLELNRKYLLLGGILAMAPHIRSSALLCQVLQWQICWQHTDLTKLLL